MKWRRRVFAFSLIFGAGVLCFGPALSHALSRRIAMQWNAETKIESSKLSIQSSSLSLSGLSIEHDDFSLIGEQIYLKFVPERLWYRDCVIESLIAKDVSWRMPDAKWNDRKGLSPTNASIAQSLDAVRAFEQRCNEKQTRVGSQLDLLEKSLTTTENESDLKGQRIELQLQNLITEVAALRAPDSHTNPLRSSRRVEGIRSKSREIEKLLAEQRLLVIHAQQSLETSLHALQKAALEQNSGISGIELDKRELSRSIAVSILSSAADGLTPYAAASQMATTLLIGRSTKHPANRPDGPSMSLFPASDSGKDVLFPTIRPRITKIIKGRVHGQSVIAGITEEFELNLSSTQKSLLDNSGKLNLYWRTPAKEASPSAVITQSFIVSEQDDQGQTAVTYEINRNEGTRVSTLNHSPSLDRTTGSVSASLQGLERIPGLAELGFDSAGFIHSNPQSVLRGTFAATAPGSFSIDAESWQLDESQLENLHNWVSQELDRFASERLGALRSAMTQQTDRRTVQFKSRIESLETNVQDRQEDWNRLLAEQLLRTKEWDAQQIRSTTMLSSNASVGD